MDHHASPGTFKAGNCDCKCGENGFDAIKWKGLIQFLVCLGEPQSGSNFEIALIFQATANTDAYIRSLEYN